MPYYQNKQAEPSPSYYAFSVLTDRGLYRYYATFIENVKSIDKISHVLCAPDGVIHILPADAWGIGCFPSQMTLKEYIMKEIENGTDCA